jgi:hypothetical protein
MDERPKQTFGWNGNVMAMHPVFKLQHLCNLTIDGRILRVMWEGNAGQRSRSFSDIEILGSDCLEDAVYLFVLTHTMLFKKYKFSSLEKSSANNVKCDLMRLHAAILNFGRSFLPDGITSTQKLIFIVNPKSGKGQAVEIMQCILPIFRVGGIDPVVHVTTHSGHAKDIISDADISLYKGVVCVGGDGTVNEVITGLLRNPRYLQHGESDFTLGVIPAGEQNSNVFLLQACQRESCAGNPYWCCLQARMER